MPLFTPPNPLLTDWRGRVAWIVGASSGIGRATAARLVRAGAQVVVSARSRDALAGFVDTYPGALALPLDVTQRDSVLAAHDDLMGRFGRIDLLLYCAGHYQAQRATALDLDELLRHEQVNYVGALHVLDAVLPVLLAQGSGHLSLVASVAGWRGLPNALAYGPTKAALNNLAECLHLDLSARGLGVSVINPGFVETPLTAGNPFPMPALIQPDEAAAAMLAGWARGEFDIHYPKRFTRLLRLLRCLPHRLYFPLVRKVTGL
jgi:NAD(P)-dependent dehydrogenase (short-subunit alcohol dehydrogenase family)